MLRTADNDNARRKRIGTLKRLAILLPFHF